MFWAEELKYRAKVQEFDDKILDLQLRLSAAREDRQLYAQLAAQQRFQARDQEHVARMEAVEAACDPHAHPLGRHSLQGPSTAAPKGFSNSTLPPAFSFGAPAKSNRLPPFDPRKMWGSKPDGSINYPEHPGTGAPTPASHTSPAVSPPSGPSSTHPPGSSAPSPSTAAR